MALRNERRQLPAEPGGRGPGRPHRMSTVATEASLLAVDKRTAHVGESIQVQFDIKSACEPQDWIGLYLCEDSNPNNYLEYRNRGVTGGRTGCLSWLLDPVSFERLRGATAKVQFCYYHSNSTLEAMSVPIIVTLPMPDPRGSLSENLSHEDIKTILVSGIYARDLKKKMFARPDPILRVRIVPGPMHPFLPHHEQQAKTRRAKSTCNPVWTGEVLKLNVVRSDVIEFYLKSSKTHGEGGFLGKSFLSLHSYAGEERSGEVVLTLERQSPGEHITGVVGARIDFVTDDRATVLPRQQRTTISDESDSDSERQSPSSGSSVSCNGRNSVVSVPQPLPPNANGRELPSRPPPLHHTVSDSEARSSTRSSGQSLLAHTYQDVLSGFSANGRSTSLDDVLHNYSGVTSSASNPYVLPQSRSQFELPAAAPVPIDHSNRPLPFIRDGNPDNNASGPALPRQPLGVPYNYSVVNRPAQPAQAVQQAVNAVLAAHSADSADQHMANATSSINQDISGVSPSTSSVRLSQTTRQTAEDSVRSVTSEAVDTLVCMPSSLTSTLRNTSIGSGLIGREVDELTSTLTGRSQEDSGMENEVTAMLEAAPAPASVVDELYDNRTLGVSDGNSGSGDAADGNAMGITLPSNDGAGPGAASFWSNGATDNIPSNDAPSMFNTMFKLPSNLTLPRIAPVDPDFASTSSMSGGFSNLSMSDASEDLALGEEQSSFYADLSRSRAVPEVEVSAAAMTVSPRARSALEQLAQEQSAFQVPVEALSSRHHSSRTSLISLDAPTSPTWSIHSSDGEFESFALSRARNASESDLTRAAGPESNRPPPIPPRDSPSLSNSGSSSSHSLHTSEASPGLGGRSSSSQSSSPVMPENSERRNTSPAAASEGQTRSHCEYVAAPGSQLVHPATASEATVGSPPPPIPPRDASPIIESRMSVAFDSSHSSQTLPARSSVPSSTPNIFMQVLAANTSGASSGVGSGSAGSSNTPPPLPSGSSAATSSSAAERGPPPPLPPRDTTSSSAPAQLPRRSSVSSNTLPALSSVARARPPRPNKPPVPALPSRNATLTVAIGRPSQTTASSTAAEQVQARPARPAYQPAGLAAAGAGVAAGGGSGSRPSSQMSTYGVRPFLPPLPPPPTHRQRPPPPLPTSDGTAASLPFPMASAAAGIAGTRGRAAPPPVLGPGSISSSAGATSDISSPSSAVSLELPRNWEAREDQYGRTFFINHQTRVTTWERPTNGESEATTTYAQQRIQLDRRYASMRRNYGAVEPAASRRGDTTTSPSTHLVPSPRSLASRPDDSASLSPRESVTLAPRPSPGARNGTPQSSSGTLSPRSSLSASPATPAVPSELSASPAVRFLLRQDLYTMIGNTANSQTLFYDNRQLVEKVRRVRENPSLFSKYMHHKDLVAWINTFSDAEATMPVGWERKLDREGKAFFIDHNTRVTSYIDPRLPVPFAYTANESPAKPESDATAHPHARQLAGRGRDPRGRGASRPSRPSQRPERRVSNDSVPSSDSATSISSVSSLSAGIVPTPPPRVLTYNEQVIEYLRQPFALALIKVKQPDVEDNLPLLRTISRVTQGGVAALERLAHDMDFGILLSLMDEEIRNFAPHPVANASSSSSPSSRALNDRENASSTASATSASSSAPTSPAVGSTVQQRTVAQGRKAVSTSDRQDFGARLLQFNKQLAARGFGKGPSVLKILVTRENILQEAYSIIMKEQSRNLPKMKLEIVFKGEEGLDYGGPSREFFFLLSREVFNPYYGLFEYSANDTYTLQISPMSSMVDGALDWFRFCGRVIALALIHQRLLDAFFTRPFYKFLLGCSMDLSDIEFVDEEYHRSLSWIAENNIDDAYLDLVFTVEEEVFGQTTQKELKPGGADIAVTDKNKMEYIDLLVRWRLDRGVSEQRSFLLKGFQEVMDPKLMTAFDAHELELAIAGTVEVDIEDWQKNTLYRSGYHADHPVIKMFWTAIRKMSNESRLRLLQFVTGTSSIPFEGFSALRGSSGLRKFTIECWGAVASLPRSHTCFNRLDLPAYTAYPQLYEKLTLAIDETSSFGLE